MNSKPNGCTKKIGDNVRRLINIRELKWMVTEGRLRKQSTFRKERG